MIVVLGFLSIMVMMAVAFLTQARVERLVAGAALESMRTRQLAQSAIAASRPGMSSPAYARNCCATFWPVHLSCSSVGPPLIMTTLEIYRLDAGSTASTEAAVAPAEFRARWSSLPR